MDMEIETALQIIDRWLNCDPFKSLSIRPAPTEDNPTAVLIDVRTNRDTTIYSAIHLDTFTSLIGAAFYLKHAMS